MLPRAPEDGQPCDDPDQVERARHEECGSPSETDRQERHHKRSNDRSHVRPTVKEPGGQRALPLWKPVRDGLDRGWKIRSFTNSEGKASEHVLYSIAPQR